MARDTNLFHKLVDDEDTLTELLANLLQFAAFRDIFTQFLTEKLNLPGFSFQYANVATQKALTDQSRPDLVIENESFCIFVECKVTDFRELTQHQPESYLKYLDTMIHKQCALIFLIPYYYEHEALIGQRAVACGSTIQPVLVYWTELLKRIESITGENIAIKHFVALLHAWFDYKPIIFSKEELMLLQNREFPAALLNLFELIQEVGDKFPKSFKLEFIANVSGLGYYVKNQKGHYLLWFGCGFASWKEHGHCLVMGVSDNEYEDFSPAVIARFREKFGSAVIRDESDPELGLWHVVSIPENLIEGPDKVKKIGLLIAQTAEYCDASKPKHK